MYLLQKHFTWDEAYEVQIHEAWKRKCGDRYKSLMYDCRRVLEKPTYVPDEVWHSWLPHWNTEEFKAKSSQCSKNRLSEVEGIGSGPSRHSGGCLSTREHARRLGVELGREPLPHEILERTHRRKGTGEFVDERSKKTYESIISFASAASQSEGDSPDQSLVDMRQIYLDKVGGSKKQRIYGIGSQAVIAYPQAMSTSSSSTSSPYNQAEFDTRVNEAVAAAMEMMEQRRQEMDQQRQREMQEQRLQEMEEQRQRDEERERIIEELRQKEQERQWEMEEMRRKDEQRQQEMEQMRHEMDQRQQDMQRLIQQQFEEMFRSRLGGSTSGSDSASHRPPHSKS